MVAWDSLSLAVAMLHGAAGVWIAIEETTLERAPYRRSHIPLMTARAASLLVLGIATTVAAIAA